ncbi:MAG: AmmeMemoRadiSam system protein A [Chloroflexi bacterium]|nr:AmmeMemoRadiSam system protein A [Chloroflexota bacterium]
MNEPLTDAERQTLLRLARSAIEAALKGGPPPKADLRSMPPALKENGASFVTLTMDGDLRGCIGALEAHQPLAQDVCEHAVAAAFQDPRFPPVEGDELARIRIEISRLTAPRPLEYTNSEELLAMLRPHIDGVILKDGYRRATFLPQVWEKIPDAVEFLDHLCQKMGAHANLWRTKTLQVLTYQVEDFHELN